MVLQRRPFSRLMPRRYVGEFEDLERWTDEMMRSFFPSMWRRVPAEETAWMPAIEMFEKEDKYVINAELPGMRREDIDISMVGDTLKIRGDRKSETEVKEEEYYCCERQYGSFFRSLTMPSSVDVNAIEAKYENGILEIHVPKAVEVKQKRIEVGGK